MTSSAAGLRLMAVHAHPDDETLLGAGALIDAAEHGHETILVTCTGGELGEPGDPPAPSPEQLRQVRGAELAAACAVMNITYLRLLGYRDSGMAGTAENQHPESFWSADVEGATTRLVRIVRELRPHVIITYDEQGFYGHPDHIQTNRITRRAFDAAGDPSFAPSAGAPWAPAKLYYGTISHSSLRRAEERILAAGIPTPFEGQDMTKPDWGVPDERITLRIDYRRYTDRMRAAIAKHRSQVTDTDFFLAMSPELFGETLAQEEFVLVRSMVPVPEPETSVLDGLPAELGAVPSSGA